MSKTLRTQMQTALSDYEKKTSDALRLAKNPTPAGYMAQGRAMAYDNVVLMLLSWLGQ